MKLRALVAAWLLALASTNALADFARVGPANVPSPPGNGFPKWYQDLNGLVLDLCLPDATDPGALQQTACLLAGPPNPPFVFPTNYPDEAFYFRATTGVDLPGGRRAVLVLALEAAFASGAASPGEQVVFSRIRVTAGVPNPGTYRVTHPWGNETFVVDVATGDRDIVFTEDIGITPGQFTAALKGRAGPFLTRAVPTGTDPFVNLNGAMFLSDGAPVQVTGSRFTTNYFEICGPFEGAASPDSCRQTDLFTLTGRVHNLVTDPIASPLTVERATYSRSAAGTQIDVSASALPGIGQAPPALSAGAVGMPPVQMSAGALGFYYAQGIPVPAQTVPGSVSVINSGDNPPSVATRSIVDEIFIASAVYDPTAGTLTVVTTSSDKGTPAEPVPSLKLDGFPTVLATEPGIAIAGDPASAKFVVSGLAVPPPAVSVVSSAGGVGRLDITMAAGTPFPAGVPLARDDAVGATAATPGQAATPVTIPVTTNDIANPAAPITLPVTVRILAPGLSPAIGTLVANADGTVIFTPTTASGTATFKYTVTNGVGESNPATVTISVVPGAGGPIPVATNDPSAGTINVVLGQSVAIDVLANDNGNGSALVAGSVSIVQQPPAGRGTAVATPNGTITYTAPAVGGTAGQVTFTYNVTNAAGNVSNNAVVTVNVIAPGTVAVGTARCSNGPKWDLRGTASAGTTSVTLYLTGVVPALPTPAQTLATVPVTAGAWRYSQSGGAACRSPISVQSSLGAKQENVTVQLR